VGGFRLAHYHLGVTNVSDKSEANIATADVLTLLLHNQRAIVFAIDQFTQWRSENGVGDASDNAPAAMETLDANAQCITDAICGYTSLSTQSRGGDAQMSAKHF
jgi:hypothetical protein